MCNVTICAVRFESDLSAKPEIDLCISSLWFKNYVSPFLAKNEIYIDFDGKNTEKSEFKNPISLKW